MKYAADHAAEPNIYFNNVQVVALAIVAQLETYIVYTDNFAAIHVDDLLIQKIALNAQHIFIGMIGDQLFIREA